MELRLVGTGGCPFMVLAYDHSTMEQTVVPDDKSKRGPADRRKVAALQEHEVRRIAKQFHVSMSAVRKVINKVGNDRERVKAALRG